jgi:hypothetical protein
MAIGKVMVMPICLLSDVMFTYDYDYDYEQLTPIAGP